MLVNSVTWMIWWLILLIFFCVAHSGKDESSGSNLGYIAAGVGGFLVLVVIVTVIIVTIVMVRKRSRTRYVYSIQYVLLYTMFLYCICDIIF